jgi:hypothetical protein
VDTGTRQRMDEALLLKDYPPYRKMILIILKFMKIKITHYIDTHYIKIKMTKLNNAMPV